MTTAMTTPLQPSRKQASFLIATLAVAACLGATQAIAVPFQDTFDAYTNGLLSGQGAWEPDQGNLTNAFTVIDGVDPISSNKVVQLADLDGNSYAVGTDLDGRVNGDFVFHARHMPGNNLANHSNPSAKLYATLSGSVAPDPFFSVGFLNAGISWAGFAPGGVGNDVVSNVVSLSTWYRFDISFQLGPNGGTNAVELMVSESVSGTPILATNLLFQNNQGNRDRLGRIAIGSGSSHDPCEFEFDSIALDVIETNCPPVEAATFEDFDGLTNGLLLGQNGWEDAGTGTESNSINVIDIPDPISCFNVMEIVDTNALGHGIAHNTDGPQAGFLQFYARHLGNNLENNSGLNVRMFATLANSAAPDRFFQVGLSPAGSGIAWSGFAGGVGDAVVSNVVVDGQWYRFDVDYQLGPNGGTNLIDLAVVDVEADSVIVATNLAFNNNQGGRDRFGQVAFLTGSTHLPSLFHVDHISINSPLTPFPITNIVADAAQDQVVITWEAEDGVGYRLQRNDDLVGGTFTDLQTGIAGAAPSVSYTDTVAGATNATYRVTGD